MHGGTGVHDDVVVRALAAPEGWLRVWVGTLNQNDPQRPRLWLDDVKIGPEEQQCPRTFRRVEMAHGRLSSGVIDLPCPPSDQTHRVRVEIDTSEGVLESEELKTRTVPIEVPPEAPFNVLLVSCYAADNDVQVASVVRTISRSTNVDLVLTVGDQVYLDQPLAKADPRALIGLLTGGFNRFLEDKYWRNFSGEDLGPGRPNGLAAILRLAPSAAIPDDHEYWNNYPTPSAGAAPATLIPQVRQGWKAAAKALYDSYQLAEQDKYDYRIDVHPLSFWMMDNRTFREDEPGTTLRDGGLAEFTAWMDEVVARRLIPVLVTGPSIVQPPVSERHGRFFDYNFANFGDYPQIVKQLVRPSAADLPMLLLTGDVHYGRVVRLNASKGGGAAAYGERWIHEVISSPASLVSPIAEGNVDMSEGPTYFAPLFDRRLDYQRLYPNKTWPGIPGLPAPEQRADNVALLQFLRTGGGIELRVTYYPIPRRSDVRFAPQQVAPIRLPT